MTTLTNALDTVFVPGVGDFIVQATPLPAFLDRRNTAGAAWAAVDGVPIVGALIVNNPVAGAEYRFRATPAGTTNVQADQ